MRSEAEKLQQLLQHIGDNSTSVHELTDLVHVARSIAQAQFESHRYSITRVSIQHGLTLPTWLTIVLPICFAKAADGSYRHLTGFLNSLQRPLMGQMFSLPSTASELVWPMRSSPTVLHYALALEEFHEGRGYRRVIRASREAIMAVCSGFDRGDR